MMNIWTFQHRFWSVVTGAEIPLDSEIEGGLLIPHPNGIVIHSQSKIGPNCLIFQQVTLGTRGDSGAPIIQGRVDIGAGARVLGDVVIRDYSKIGANALVLSSFPKGSVLVGIPARRVGLTKKMRPKKLRTRTRLAAGQN
jgi:serine O-acetyltransferase